MNIHWIHLRRVIERIFKNFEEMAKDKKTTEKVKDVGDKMPPAPPTVSELGEVHPSKTPNDKTADSSKKSDSKNAEKVGERSGKSRIQTRVTSVTSAKAPRHEPAPVDDHVEGERSEIIKDLINDALKQFGLEKATTPRQNNMSDSDIMPRLQKITPARGKRRRAHVISDSETETEIQRPEKKSKKDDEIVWDDSNSDRDFAVDDDQIDQLFSDSENEPVAAENEAEKDWIDEFGKELDIEEETGPAIPENLAEIVTKMLQKRLPEDKQKDLLNLLPRPENVPMLVAPRVNNSIWLKMKHESRKNDIKTSQIQEKVTKALVANVRVVEKLSQLRSKMTDPSIKGEVKDITKQALKTVQVGAIAIQNLSQKRRQDMRQDLNAAYRALCSLPDKEETELFGEGLAAKVRELNEARRMGHQVADSRPKPWRKPFLGTLHQINPRTPRMVLPTRIPRGGRFDPPQPFYVKQR